jgi:Mg-chelatase subunit ChlD
MRDNLTDITLVVDRSGSMESVRGDAEGGINAFLAEQAKAPGEALLTLVEFDDKYEFLHRGVPVGEVPRYTLRPRGMTALLDAVGRGINETGERLAAMREEERPGLVIFVVMTDGHENASGEFSKEQVKAMIERQQREFSWHFTFLGADQDAFAEAEGMGIAASGTAKFSKSKMQKAYSVTSGKVSRMRSQRILGSPVSNEFTDKERKEME